MSNAARKLNMVLFPLPGGGAITAALEDFSLAFGSVLEQSKLDALISQRETIEQSLRDNAERPTPDKLANYGQLIAEALLSGEVNSLYTVLGQDGVQLTVATGDPVLKRVPWEYIEWPDTKQGPHAARSVARAVAVPNATAHSARKLKSGKLKVLLIGADVLGGDPIPWDETKANLERIFGERMGSGPDALAVDVEMVEGATRDGFREAVVAKSYDIIHFIGHGESDGIFLRGSTGGSGEKVPKAALTPMLTKKAPAVLILSACSTGQVTSGGSFDSLAEALVSAGIPAVVANQMPINVSAIADFCAALYGSLLDSGNIDIAVNAGRMRLAEMLSSAESAAVEWGIPVLYRRPGCSQLFEM